MTWSGVAVVAGSGSGSDVGCWSEDAALRVSRSRVFLWWLSTEIRYRQVG